MSALDAAVSALVYSLCRERAGDDPVRFAPPYNDEARFVAVQLDGCAPQLRWPLRAMTLLFDLAHAPLGKVFHLQEPEARAARVRAWRGSRWKPCRDLIRFYESLSFLALYSR